jgi:hypothetical protein
MTAPDIPTPPGLSLDDLDDPPESVGSAQMEPDGTLKLFFRTETKDGMVGEALTVVKPGDKHYDSIRAHLGGIKPGQGVPIPPFPPPEVDPDSI